LQSSRKLDQAGDERCADYFNGKMLTFSASGAPYVLPLSAIFSGLLLWIARTQYIVKLPSNLSHIELAD
jgi:hypothetical protein